MRDIPLSSQRDQCYQELKGPFTWAIEHTLDITHYILKWGPENLYTFTIWPALEKVFFGLHLILRWAYRIITLSFKIKFSIVKLNYIIDKIHINNSTFQGSLDGFLDSHNDIDVWALPNGNLCQSWDAFCQEWLTQQQYGDQIKQEEIFLQQK